MTYAFDLTRLRAALRDAVRYRGRNPTPVAVLSAGPVRGFNSFGVWRRMK